MGKNVKKRRKRESGKLKKVELFSSLLVFTVGPIGLNVLDVEHEKRLEHVEVAARHGLEPLARTHEHRV